MTAERDIVERLRDACDETALCREAAGEIESLRADLAAVDLPPPQSLDLARRIVTAAIAENIRFRLGVLGATVDERRQYAGQIVEILQRPFLRRALSILARQDCGPVGSV